MVVEVEEKGVWREEIIELNDINWDIRVIEVLVLAITSHEEAKREL
jgi:hypothetical protein